MPGHRDGGLVGELQVFGADLHAAGLDGLHLIREVVEVDDHTGAQHTGDIRVQDAGGQKVQDELALFGDDGVPGIVAALIAGNDIGVFGQQVDDAAFALIAPIDSSNSGQHDLLYPSFCCSQWSALWWADRSFFRFPLAIFDRSAIIRAGKEYVKRILHMAAI